MRDPLSRYRKSWQEKWEEVFSDTGSVTLCTSYDIAEPVLSGTMEDGSPYYELDTYTRRKKRRGVEIVEMNLKRRIVLEEGGDD